MGQTDKRRVLGMILIFCLLATGCASHPATQPETTTAAEAIFSPNAEPTESSSATEKEEPEAENNPIQPISGTAVIVDGLEWTGKTEESNGADGTRVYLWLGGDLMAAFPFEEAHTIVIRQADGSENTVRMTGSAVYMEDATCANHDCIQMGEITMENLEMRVMGGFIVCLPQQVIVEVRTN